LLNTIPGSKFVAQRVDIGEIQRMRGLVSEEFGDA